MLCCAAGGGPEKLAELLLGSCLVGARTQSPLGSEHWPHVTSHTLNRTGDVAGEVSAALGGDMAWLLAAAWTPSDCIRAGVVVVVVLMLL